MPTTEEQKAVACLKGFTGRLFTSGHMGYIPKLMTVCQSQAYFVKSTPNLGILCDFHEFFEFDPNGHHNTRAVVFDFTDGPDQLEMVIKSIDQGADMLWVPYVLNSSANNFVTPAARTSGLVETLVASAPKLSQSPALQEYDYRTRVAQQEPTASDAATQTLLVFVAVAFGEEGKSVFGVCRIRGANLLCGNENCQFRWSPALSSRDVCRLCHGMYVCGTECNLGGGGAAGVNHVGLCHAIRTTHRAWLLHRRTPAAPQFIVPQVLGPEAEEGWPEMPEEDAAAAAAGGPPAAAAAADEGEEPRMLPPNSPYDMSSDDEAVDDTQPTDDVEVVLETPLPAPPVADSKSANNTTARRRELFAQM